MEITWRLKLSSSAPSTTDQHVTAFVSPEPTDDLKIAAAGASTRHSTFARLFTTGKHRLTTIKERKIDKNSSHNHKP
jgi:hypothetical protein